MDADTAMSLCRHVAMLPCRLVAVSPCRHVATSRPDRVPVFAALPLTAGKLGPNAMKRVAAGAHLPTPWLFQPAKRPDDRADHSLLKMRYNQCLFMDRYKEIIISRFFTLRTFRDLWLAFRCDRMYCRRRGRAPFHPSSG